MLSSVSLCSGRMTELPESKTSPEFSYSSRPSSVRSVLISS